MVIYDEKLTADLGAKVKKGLWLGIVPFAVSLLLSVGLCFLLDENNSNATPLHVGAVAISLISGWYFLTVLLVFVLPNAKAGKRAYRLISAVKKQAEGTDYPMTTRLRFFLPAFRIRAPSVKSAAMTMRSMEETRSSPQ